MRSRIFSFVTRTPARRWKRSILSLSRLFSSTSKDVSFFSRFGVRYEYSRCYNLDRARDAIDAKSRSSASVAGKN